MLPERALLRLILSTVERVEKIVSAASDYMTTALASLDTQLTELQTRLAADAQELQDAIAALDLAGQDTTALTAARGSAATR